MLSVAPLLYPPISTWGSYDMAFLVLGTIAAIITILSGLAVQRLRPQFGYLALWYGVGAMLSDVIVLGSDFGLAVVIAFALALNIVLYGLGLLSSLKLHIGDI